MNRRVVLVTGSTSGIGRGIATRFAQGGDHVVVHGLDDPTEAHGEVDRAGPGQVVSVSGDLTDPDTPAMVVGEAVAALGQIDVLVNNAGANVYGGVLDSTLDDWQRAIDLNLRAAWLMARSATPHIPAGGSIISISSNHAYTTMPGCFPYNVAKAGLLGLTTALAVELADRGIRANTICPGWTFTPAIEAEIATNPMGASAMHERLAALHLTGRIGTPCDVAEAAWYLAAAGQVTGSHLIVDGGRAAVMEDATTSPPTCPPI